MTKRFEITKAPVADIKTALRRTREQMAFERGKIEGARLVAIGETAAEVRGASAKRLAMYKIHRNALNDELDKRFPDCDA